MSRRRTRLSLGPEPLELRVVPAFLSGAQVITASDSGGPPVVRLLDPQTGTVDRQFLAFAADFTGGVRVAVGDVNGDGVTDLVLGAGPGGGSAVRAVSGVDGSPLTSFFPFAERFSGGVHVAAADVTGNGWAEIIVGAGAGGGPQVVVWDAVTGQIVGSFFAYDPSFSGGVYVAAGDTTGDGMAEIITGTEAGAPMFVFFLHHRCLRASCGPTRRRGSCRGSRCRRPDPCAVPLFRTVREFWTVFRPRISVLRAVVRFTVFVQRFQLLFRGRNALL